MPALGAALDEVAAMLRDARDPWWVIGSAAARLHGAATSVADVDLLLSRRDALAVAGAWRGEIATGTPGDRFRSARFLRLRGAALPVELMAGLEVRTPSGWQLVLPRTRVALGGVYVPGRDELVAIFDLFAREKDRERAALLRKLPKGAASTD